MQEYEEDVNVLQFNSFGTAMGFQMKVMKHMESNNPEKVKDYMCAAYDTVNPETAANHPCIDIIREAKKFLENNGWKVGTMAWKDQGVQLVCISPDGSFYRSHYQH